jgi:hypothetical protein
MDTIAQHLAPLSHKVAVPRRCIALLSWFVLAWETKHSWCPPWPDRQSLVPRFRVRV